jgi:hypothetical protein
VLTKAQSLRDVLARLSPVEPIGTSSLCRHITISDGAAHGTNLDRRNFDLENRGRHPDQ